MNLKKSIEIEAQRRLAKQLIKLEKNNAELMKQKIDDFALKARLWIKEEVKEALEKALKTPK